MTDNTIKLLKNYIKHMQKRKAYYWGKDQEIYNRYDCQEIVVKDILAHAEAGDTER